MANDREAQIARIQQIERIKALEAKTAGGSEPGAPGVGVTEGPTPAAQEGVIQKTLKGVGMGVGAVGKTLDVARGSLTGPALAYALEKITGKPVYKGEEQLNAINPTNLEMFPSSAELYKRAGVPQGAKLSDYVSYGAKGSPWYMPEAGGMLDPTLRGAGGLGTDIAIDPLTYLSLGSTAAAKQALKAGVSRQAAEAVAKQNAGVISKILAPIKGAGQAGLDVATAIPAAVAEQVAKVPGGKAAIAVSRAPSKLIDKIGTKLYEAPVLGVEHEGAKYGKEAVAQTLYDLGIKTPENLTAKTKEATGALMSARDKLLAQATEAGAKVPIADAAAGAREQIAKLRAIKDPEAHALADQLEKKIAGYETIEKGVPAGPATVEKVPSGKYTEYMDPIMESKVTPGKPGVAPSPYTPEEATKLKTFLYNNLPGNIWGETGAKVTPANAVREKLASGLKTGTENAVESVLPGQGGTLAELNAEAGKLLSTRKAQQAAERQYDRLTSGPTGTTKVVTALKGPQAGIVDMIGNWLRANQMRGGYGLKKLAESELTGPMIDAYLRRKYIQQIQPQPQP